MSRRRLEETFEELKEKNNEALKATYKRVDGQVKDPALMKDIHVLMRLSREKGIYEEVEDQRIFHMLMEK